MVDLLGGAGRGKGMDKREEYKWLCDMLNQQRIQFAPQMQSPFPYSDDDRLAAGLGMVGVWRDLSPKPLEVECEVIDETAIGWKE